LNNKVKCITIIFQYAFDNYKKEEKEKIIKEKEKMIIIIIRLLIKY
jgi:hypothetical protein